jgi:hypothetical protein
LQLSGGFVGGPSAANIGKDNKKWLNVGWVGQNVAINFANSGLGCSGDALEDFLVDGAELARVSIQISKSSVVKPGDAPVDDPSHWIVVQRDETAIDFPWVGLSMASSPNLIVTLIEGDINDASKPRVFEMTDGSVKIIQGIDNQTANVMVCDQALGDVVTVTLEPSSGP